MKRGRLPLYPWDLWFAVGRFRVVKDEHYRCSTEQMRQQVWQAASKRGVSVQTEVIDDGNGLAVTVLRQSAN